jgi:hypothetical protein
VLQRWQATSQTEVVRDAGGDFGGAFEHAGLFSEQIDPPGHRPLDKDKAISPRSASHGAIRAGDIGDLEAAFRHSAFWQILAGYTFEAKKYGKCPGYVVGDASAAGTGAHRGHPSRQLQLKKAVAHPDDDDALRRSELIAELCRCRWRW